MSTQPKILVVGATGFIGGTVLTTLLASQDPALKGSTFTLLVRGEDKAKHYESKGLKTILFKGFEDIKTLKDAASQHDAVINTGTGFATEAARALIQGLGQRQKATGTKPIFVHLSGTSNVDDLPISRAFVEPRYDKSPKQPFVDDKDNIYEYLKHRETTEQYPQRTTDIVAIDTGIAEHVQTYIVMPPLIWGRGTGHYHLRSIQVPSLVKAALKNGQSGLPGKGIGEMDHVHVEDLADFFALLLAKALNGEQLPEGKQGIYFAESGTHTWADIGQGIGQAGKKLGHFDTAEVRELSLEQAGKQLANSTIGPEHIEHGFAINSRTQANLARSLGWKPKYTRADFLNSFEDEFDAAKRGE